MTYKTHLAVGYASVMLTVPPKSCSEFVSFIGVTAIGSVISDVDATTSESRKSLKKTVFVAAAAIALTFIADLFTGTEIINHFRSSSALMRLFTGFIIFLGICIFGEHQPHRSFMHSLAGVTAVTLSFAVIFPSAAKYMAVSMLSHILIDTLNKKKIQLFYPLPRPRIGFNLCYADGIANRLIFLISAAVSVILIAVSINNYLLPQITEYLKEL